MARYLAILLSTLLGLNVVLGVTGGPVGGPIGGPAGGITICLGHDHHTAPAADHAEHAHAECDDEQVHLHLAEHADCCCANLPLTVAEAPEFARTDSELPAPHAAESFPLDLPPVASAADQRQTPLPPPGEEPCAQTPRRHVRTIQLRL